VRAVGAQPFRADIDGDAFVVVRCHRDVHRRPPGPGTERGPASRLDRPHDRVTVKVWEVQIEYPWIEHGLNVPDLRGDRRW